MPFLTQFLLSCFPARPTILGWSVLVEVAMTVCFASPDSKRLYDDLLKKSGYNRLIRPVENNSDTLVVKLGLRLTQIIDVVGRLSSFSTQSLLLVSICNFFSAGVYSIYSAQGINESKLIPRWLSNASDICKCFVTGG